MNSVLDASALLACLHDEPGAQAVTAALERTCAMSMVNWAEVLSKLAEHGLDPEAVSEQLERRGILGTGLLLVPLDEVQARIIASLRPLTRRRGLSLGDRACLALAQSLGLPALTTDQTWTKLRLDMQIEVIR